MSEAQCVTCFWYLPYMMYLTVLLSSWLNLSKLPCYHVSTVSQNTIVKSWHCSDWSLFRKQPFGTLSNTIFFYLSTQLKCWIPFFFFFNMLGSYFSNKERLHFRSTSPVFSSRARAGKDQHHHSQNLSHPTLFQITIISYSLEQIRKKLAKPTHFVEMGFIHRPSLQKLL